LLDDSPFTRCDIIHLQDPSDVSGNAARRAVAASVAAAAAPSASVHGTSSSSFALPSAAASAAAERKNSSSSSGSCLDASALGKDAQGILARIGGTGPGSVAGGRGDRGAGRLLSSAAAAQEAAAAAAAAAATPDPRLRAPERERVAAPAFKLGAAIWATDGDLSQLSFQARKEAERKRKKLEEEEEKAREEEERQRRRKKEKKGGGEGASKFPPRRYGDEPFKRLAAASRPVAFTSSVTPLSPSSSTANSHLSSLLLLLQSSGSLRPPRAMHDFSRRLEHRTPRRSRATRRRKFHRFGEERILRRVSLLLQREKLHRADRGPYWNG
jgi:hypothetical protein